MELEKFWLDPDRIPSCRLQFNKIVLTKSRDRIDFSEHALEQFFRTKLVLNTRGVIVPWETDHQDLITDSKFAFTHE